jgi:uncharacterized protein YwgA
MRITDIILTVIDHNGQFTGRTLLQKAIFFLNEIVDLNISFRPHYYGPYSSDVAIALENLVNIGFLNETEERFSAGWNVWGEVRRYTFELTNEGKEIMETIRKSPKYQNIKKILDKLGKFAVSKDYDKLSKAAKIYHIVKSKGEITKLGIKQEAKKLGWNLTKNEITDMSSFLEKLGLINIVQSKKSKTH